MTENFGNPADPADPGTTETRATTRTSDPEPDAAPPPPPPRQPEPGVNTSALKDVRSWRRAVGHDRKVAGVAAGIGRALNIDPTLLRVLFVVLAFANGFGLLVYAVAWLLMPEEGQDEPIIKSSNAMRTALVVAAAILAAVIGVAALGALWAAGTPGPWTPWPLVPVALVVIAIIWIAQHKESRPMTQTAHPAPGAPAPPAEAGTPAPSYSPAPRVQRGPALFGITLALLALGLGILGIADQTGSSVPDSAYPALALAIIGLMLVVGSFFGRPGGLIFLGIVSAIVLAATATVGPRWDGGHDIQAYPTSASAVQQSYDLGAGQVRLDLTQVTDLADLDGRTIDINLNVGDVLVIVPRDLAVNVTANIRYGGAIQLPGKDASGWGESLTQVVNPGAATGINLNINIRFGHIEVTNS